MMEVAEEESHAGSTGPTDLSAGRFALVALRRWKWIVLPAAIAALISAGVSLLRPREYRSQASFAVATGGQSGALQGLAMQFMGGSLLTPNSRSPQFYQSVLESDDILLRLAESRFVDDLGSGPRRATLGAILIGRNPTDPWSRHEVLSRLRGHIDTETDLPSGMVRVFVTFETPRLADEVAARLLTLLQDFDVRRRQIRAAQEEDFAAQRLKEAESRLQAAEEALQEFRQRNRRFGESIELQLEHDRLTRAVSTRQQIFLSLVQVHEQSRLEAVRDTPTILVVDDPAGSALPVARGTILKALFAFVLIAAGITILLLFSEALRVGRERGDRYLEEIHAGWIKLLERAALRRRS